MQLVTGATTTCRSNSVNVHEEFSGYTISDCIKHATLTMLFKVVRRNSPEYLINIRLDLNLPRYYILWNNANVRVPFCRLDTYKKSFIPRAISLYHDLTVKSQSKGSVKNFKNQFAVEHRELHILYYYGE